MQNLGMVSLTSKKNAPTSVKAIKTMSHVLVDKPK